MEIMMEFTALQNYRYEILVPYITNTGKGLEIGPGMHPTLDKKKFSISFLDYIHREAQREHCPTDVDFQRVPETDILVSSDQYTKFTSECYDYIIANHVIEHITDVIGWFRELESMLVDGGVLFLSIPDKKFTFDKYRQNTAFHHLVSDYFHKPGYSDNEHILDVYINYDSTFIGKTFNPVSKMNQDYLYKEFIRNPFIGLHRHVFSGDTFLQKILKPILVSGFCGLNIERYIPTGNWGEFYVILRKKHTKYVSLRDDEFIECNNSNDREQYIEDLQQKIQILHNELRCYTNSRSWRLTAPLRRLATLFRKVRNRVIALKRVSLVGQKPHGSSERNDALHSDIVNPKETQMSTEENSIINPCFVDRYPDDNNAVNVFKDQWITLLPGHESTTGNAHLFEDKRLSWFLSVNPVQGKTILELGPLEAAHTYILEKHGGATVVAIEGHQNSFMKSLIVKNLYDLRSKFLLGNFIDYVANETNTYDVIFASGVLYHMQDPLKFLENISKLTDTIFLWTHYCTSDDTGYAQKEPVIVQYHGKEIIMHQCLYGESVNRANFPGGIRPVAYWMNRQSILDVLSLLGFNELLVGCETPTTEAGPAFCVLAKRT